MFCSFKRRKTSDPLAAALGGKDERIVLLKVGAEGIESLSGKEEVMAGTVLGIVGSTEGAAGRNGNA
jgi:hypothetical protein